MVSDPNTTIRQLALDFLQVRALFVYILLWNITITHHRCSACATQIAG